MVENNLDPSLNHEYLGEGVDDMKIQDLILELKCLGEVLAMEMTTIEGNPIAPIVDSAWQTIEKLTRQKD